MLKIGQLDHKKQKVVVIVSFLFIPLLLLAVFTYLPVLNMIYYSFTDWNGYRKNIKIIGLDNYITIFTNPDYFEVFGVSLYYFIASFVQMGLALFFATILSFHIRMKNFFKGVLFFPSLLNGVAIGFIFLFFFRPDGSFDSLLNMFGLKGAIHMWLLDPSIVNISLAGASIWRYMGFNFIIFLGVIASIPQEIFEAASIDGASRWQQFRFIILPSIKSILQLNMILAISGSISAFDIPFIMLDGSNGSQTFVIQTVDVAFKYNKIGLASAMAVVLLLIVLVVTLVQKTLIKEDN